MGGGQRLKFVVDIENYPTLYKEDEAVDGITNQWGITLSSLQV